MLSVVILATVNGSAASTTEETLTLTAKCWLLNPIKLCSFAYLLFQLCLKGLTDFIYDICCYYYFIGISVFEL